MSKDRIAAKMHARGASFYELGSLIQAIGVSKLLSEKKGEDWKNQEERMSVELQMRESILKLVQQEVEVNGNVQLGVYIIGVLKVYHPAMNPMKKSRIIIIIWHILGMSCCGHGIHSNCLKKLKTEWSTPATRSPSSVPVVKQDGRTHQSKNPVTDTSLDPPPGSRINHRHHQNELNRNPNSFSSTSTTATLAELHDPSSLTPSSSSVSRPFLQSPDIWSLSSSQQNTIFLVTRPQKMDEPAAKRKPIDSGEEAEPQDDGQQQLNTSPQPSVKRRKIGPISTDEERSSSISSIESEHSSHKSEPEEPLHRTSSISRIRSSGSTLESIQRKLIGGPDWSMRTIPESRAVLANVFSPKREKSRATSPESEDLDDADSDLDDFDGPDQELEIPGERYSVDPVPRVGQVQTKEIKFEKMVPQIEKELHHLDQIINGKSSDSNLISKHESFLTSIKHRASIPQDVKYGKYSEELIHKVGDYLRDRYLSIQTTSKICEINRDGKSQYIFDILVPELIWLITVTQYLEDGEEKLIAESNLESSTSNKQLDKDKDKDNSSVSQQNITITSEKILEEAKKLATLDIHEVDLVDKVHSLRADKKFHLSKKSLTTYNNKSSNLLNPLNLSKKLIMVIIPILSLLLLLHPQNFFRYLYQIQSRGNSKLRQTSNSRKTCTS
ncbi:hypothetical protein H4Q26_011244 [Puccinia striiformis f. sp. tritici PST-130]|nr:hypothetical protein H4Q26_011244 [Puccinia striiformis f. sp. tritici PST-130]